MQKFDTNPLANFDGVTMPVEADSMDEPDWDGLVIDPYVKIPSWDDGDEG